MKFNWKRFWIFILSYYLLSIIDSILCEAWHIEINSFYKIVDCIMAAVITFCWEDKCTK